MFPAASLILAAGICLKFAIICRVGLGISELMRNSGDSTPFPFAVLCLRIFHASTLPIWNLGINQDVATLSGLPEALCKKWTTHANSI